MQYGEYDQGQVLDFSTLSYEEWIRFLFEQRLRTSIEERSPYNYYKFVKQLAMPTVYVEYLTRLFHDLPQLVQKYGLAQIDQGLWAVSEGFAPGPSIRQLLWDSAIPIETRIACIRAMRRIYSEVVAKIPPDVEIGTSFGMWWDITCLSYDDDTRDVHRYLGQAQDEAGLEWHIDFYVSKTWILPLLMVDEPGSSRECLQKIKGLKGQLDARLKYDFDAWTEDKITKYWDNDKPLLDAVFNTMEEILEIGDARCEEYALHGLGHLLHPKKPALVQSYIDRYREIYGPDSVAWLEACRDGAFM